MKWRVAAVAVWGWTQVVAGYATEVSFWEQRRAARASHRAEDTSSSFQTDVRAFGTARFVNGPPRSGDLVVYHVQDIHGHAQAQRNIAEIISLLSEKYGVRWVGLEGASGPLAENEFRSYPPDIVEKAAENFLSKDLIGGAEWAALRSQDPLHLWGVENSALYNANVDALRLSLQEKHRLRAVVIDLKAALLKLKNAHYSKDLQRFDRHRALYESGSMPLCDFVSPPPDPSKYPQVARLAALLKADKELDYAAVEQERKRFLALDRGSPIGAGLPSTRSETEIINPPEQKIEGNRAAGASLKDFPALARYLHYVKSSDEIVTGGLVDELDLWERDTLFALASTDEQRRVAQLDEDVRLVDRALAFQLTPAQWELFQSRREHISSVPERLKQWGLSVGVDNAQFQVLVSPFESFCARAIERNTALVDGLLNKMGREKIRAAALVAGGFHTPGVTEQLTQQGVVVAVVTPRADIVNDGTGYTDSFFSEPRVSLKKLCGLADARVVSLLHRAILTLIPNTGPPNRWGWASLLAMAPSFAHAAERNLYDVALGIAATVLLLGLGFAVDSYFKTKSNPRRNSKLSATSILEGFYKGDKTPYDKDLKRIANDVRRQYVSELTANFGQPTYEDDLMNVYLTPEYRTTIFKIDFKNVGAKFRFSKKNLGGLMAPFSLFRTELYSLVVIQKRVKPGLLISRDLLGNVPNLLESLRRRGAFLDLNYHPTRYQAVKDKTGRPSSEEDFINEFGKPYGEFNGRLISTDPLAIVPSGLRPYEPKRVESVFDDKIRHAQEKFLTEALNKPQKKSRLVTLIKRNGWITGIVFIGLLPFVDGSNFAQIISDLLPIADPFGTALLAGSVAVGGRSNLNLNSESEIVQELVLKFRAFNLDHTDRRQQTKFLQTLVDEIHLNSSDELMGPLKSSIATAGAVALIALASAPPDQRAAMIQNLQNAQSFAEIIALSPQGFNVQSQFNRFLEHYREEDDGRFDKSFEVLARVSPDSNLIPAQTQGRAGLFPDLSLISSVGLSRVSALLGANFTSGLAAPLLRYDLLREFNFSEQGQGERTGPLPGGTINQLREFIDDQISVAERGLKEENSEVNRLRLLALVELRLSPKLLGKLSISKPLLLRKESRLLKTVQFNDPLMSRLNRVAHCMAQLRAIKSSVLDDELGHFGTETAHARDLELLIGAMRFSDGSFDEIFEGAAVTYNSIMVGRFKEDYWSGLAAAALRPQASLSSAHSVIDTPSGIIFDIDALMEKNGGGSDQQAAVAEILKRVLLSIDENQLSQRLVLLTSFTRKSEARQETIATDIAKLFAKKFNDRVFMRVQGLTVVSPEKNINGAFVRDGRSKASLPGKDHQVGERGTDSTGASWNLRAGNEAGVQINYDTAPILDYLSSIGKNPTQFWTHEPSRLKGTGLTVVDIVSLSETIKKFFERHLFISRNA